MAKRTGGFIGQDGINAPDQATGVGASAGEGQVEVSFTAPSDVGGAAITGYQVQSNNGDGAMAPTTIADGSYDSKSVSVAGQETGPTGIFLKPDGTKVYICGFSGDEINEYDLSTAYDISTATFNQFFSISGQEGSSRQVFFKPDGTSMYIVGVLADTVFQYTLSTAWDISTASYASKSFSVASQDNAPVGMSFKSDGTKMYISGSSSGNKVYQYSLSTAWDVSTASYDSVSFTATGVSALRGLWLSSDGSYMYLVDSTSIGIFQANMSTAWDISTASMVNGSLDVSSEDLTIYNVFGSADGTKMYLMGSYNDAIFQYSTNLGARPTSSPVTVTGLTNGTSYTFNVWAINPFGWSSPSDGVTATPTATLALFMGGSKGSSPYESTVIDYIQIATTGNATDWGDTTLSRGGSAPASNSIRGIGAGGGNIYITEVRDRIDYITFASTGNASVFGNLTQARYYRVGGISNDTRGIFVTGRNSSFQGTQTTDYVTIATTGNATNYGNYGISLREGPSGCSSTTRGILTGGRTETNTSRNEIRYTTIATVGSYSDFGDLTEVTYRHGAASNGTRGVIFGINSSNRIDYVTIASTGNAADFGDLTATVAYHEATSNKTRAVVASSNGGTPAAVDYVTVATTGNASDFGSLTATRYGMAAVGNAHGGVS